MLITRLRVGRRLTIAFLLMAALLVAIAAIGVMGLKSLNEALQRIVDYQHPKIEHLHKIIDETSSIAVALRNALLADDEAETRGQLERVEDGRKALGGMLDSLDSSFAADKEAKELQQALHSEYASYTVEVVKASRAIAAGKKDVARNFLNHGLQQRMASYLKALRSLADHEARAMVVASEHASGTFAQGRNYIAAILLFAALATAALAFALTRSITLPLRRAGSMAEVISRGDLTQRLDAQGDDETAWLAKSLNTMRDQLAATVRQIKIAADALNAASGEIARGNQDLSRRTESHASSLEETAASVEELTGSVRQNANSAREANEFAESATQIAVKGGHVVEEVVRTISSIRESSGRIAEITGVIDAIAFQTNILALNAAVEAARAGEQGRGFAVVAAEVRSLAQRSAEAAREIRNLIADSAKNVEAGSRLADDAGRTMGEIVVSVKRVGGAMSEISAASRQQSAGIGQVNGAIAQMDDMTQQNAAMVEELSAATTGLQQQAAVLVAAVAQFTLEDQGEDTAAPAPPGRRAAPRALAPVTILRPLAERPALRVATKPR